MIFLTGSVEVGVSISFGITDDLGFSSSGFSTYGFHGYLF